MKIDIKEIKEGFWDIQLSGKFNIEQIQKFEELVTPLISKKTEVVFINLSQTNYIDSSGIGILIKMMNLSKSVPLDLVLYDPSDTIRNILNLAHLDSFFTIKTSADVQGYLG